MLPVLARDCSKYQCQQTKITYSQVRWTPHYANINRHALFLDVSLLLCKQCLCSHKDSKLRFPALPETAVSACWGRTPNPLNSPVAGAGCAFVSRTLLSLRCRNRRGLRPLESRRSGRHGLAGKRKTGLVCTSCRYRIGQGSQATVWTIPKSRPGGSVNLQCPPHRCSRFRSPV